MISQQRHKIFLLTLILVGQVAYTSAARQASPPPSNQRVLAQLMVNPVLSRLQALVSQPDTLRIVSGGNSPLENWFIRTLVDSVLEQGWVVYQGQTRPAEGAYQLNFSQAHSEIHYRLVGRSLLLFPSKVERTIAAGVHVQFVSPRGRVLWSQQLEQMVRDTVPHRVISQLENRELPFTQGVFKSTGSGKKWIEPLLVTASTITVIYLFFTLRNE